MTGEHDEVKEAAKEAEEFILALPEEERAKVAKEYARMMRALVRVGKRLVSWWGGVLSDRAITTAAVVATATFLELLDRAERYAEEGVEEIEALVTAFEEVFTPSFADALMFRSAVAERIHQDLPEGVFSSEPVKREEER